MFHFISRRSYGYILKKIKSKAICQNSKYYSSDPVNNIIRNSGFDDDISNSKIKSYNKKTNNYSRKQTKSLNDTCTPDVASLNDILERQAFNYLINDVKINPGTKILLSISGGVDSMAMLHLFAKIRHLFEPKLDIEVITFNHKLRKESDEEIQFVTSIATKYDMITHIREPVEAFREDSGLQATARHWRRQESLKIISLYNNNNDYKHNNNNNNNNSERHDRESDSSSSTSGSSIAQSRSMLTSSVSASSSPSSSSSSSRPCIATAHHADDSVETMLLKFIRGVHLSHFTALSPRSKCGHFIKPLLFLNKKQIIDYMIRNQFQWKEDDSNQSRKYKRNEIRLDLVPLLEELAGGELALKKRLLQLSSQSIDLQKWIENEVHVYIQSNVHYESISLNTSRSSNISNIYNHVDNHSNSSSSTSNNTNNTNNSSINNNNNNNNSLNNNSNNNNSNNNNNNNNINSNNSNSNNSNINNSNSNMSLIAIIKDLTPTGKYFHLSNLVKMEIFDRVCQTLTSKHAEIMDRENDDSNGGNDRNYEQVLSLLNDDDDDDGDTVGVLSSSSSSLEKTKKKNGTTATSATVDINNTSSSTSASSGNTSYDERKGCFLSHDMLNMLCTIASKTFPTSKGINTQSYHINDYLTFTRNGNLIKITRDPIPRQTKKRNHTRSDS